MQWRDYVNDVFSCAIKPTHSFRKRDQQILHQRLEMNDSRLTFKSGERKQISDLVAN